GAADRLVGEVGDFHACPDGRQTGMRRLAFGGIRLGNFAAFTISYPSEADGGRISAGKSANDGYGPADEKVRQLPRKHFVGLHISPIDAGPCQSRMTNAVEEVFHDFGGLVA